LLLGPVGLELGDLRLLDDDLLGCDLLGERSGLGGLALRPVHLRLEPGLLDSVSRRAAALRASACCSCSVASRSACAWAMRACFCTSAACGAARFLM